MRLAPKSRVGQQVQPAQLRHHRRMANPGDRWLHLGRRPGVAVQKVEVGCKPEDGRLRRWRQAPARRVPAQHIRQAFRRELDVDVLETLRAMMRLAGVVVWIHASQNTGVCISLPSQAQQLVASQLS